MNGVLQRRARTLMIACACAFGAAVLAGRAIAAEPVSAAPATTPAEADRLFEEGVAAQKAGKLAEAEGLFLRAWAAKKTWDIAANLGLVQLKQGKLAEGAGRVAYAIANLPPTESDTTRERLSKAFDAARPEIGEVKLSCDVESATVRAGGKLVGTTPLGASFFVSPGAVTIEVTKDGYEPASKTMEIKKGGAEDVKLTPLPHSAPERNKVPAYVIGGVGVAGAIAGGALLGAGFAIRGDVQGSMPHDANGKPLCVRSADAGPELHPDCPGLRQREAGAETMANVGLPVLLVGVIGVAGGAAWLLWPEENGRTPKPASRLIPMASPQGAALLWTGSF